MAKRAKVKAGLWVVSSDAHWPTTDMATFNAMLDFIKRNRRKVVGYLDLGDTFDNSSISPHNKGKAIYQTPGSFKSETESYRNQFLNPLEEALPKSAEKVAITGNHTRWETDATDKHPELIGCVDRFADLRLIERGWKIIPLGMHHKIGKLTCVHGDQIGGAYGAGVVPSRKAAEIYATSVLQGHTHSPQSFCRVSPVDQTQKHMGYVSPILGTTNAHFMRNRPNAWANGFCIVEVREDGNFNLYTIIVTRGEFTFAGETYSKRLRKAA